MESPVAPLAEDARCGSGVGHAHQTEAQGRPAQEVAGPSGSRASERQDQGEEEESHGVLHPSAIARVADGGLALCVLSPKGPVQVPLLESVKEFNRSAGSALTL